jgi:hypothetical protein
MFGRSLTPLRLFKHLREKNLGWEIESSAVFAHYIDLAILITGTVCFQRCLSETNEVAHELARDCFQKKFLITGLMNPLILSLRNLQTM